MGFQMVHHSGVRRVVVGTDFAFPEGVQPQAPSTHRGVVVCNSCEVS